MDNKEALPYWITEREAVRVRRESGDPAPWSKDPIFQTTRFCNVRREDDTVTRWIRDYWNQPNDPPWKFVLGRMLNLPETLQHLCGMPKADMKARVKELRSQGQKIFTSAYTISTCGKSMDKLDYVFDHVVGNVMLLRNPDTVWCRDMQDYLTCVDGLGTFLAAQVVADMKNTAGHPLHQAPDWWTFSAPGPGSLRGLEAFWGRKIAPTGYQNALAGAWAYTQPQLPPSLQRLHMQDFQNTMCEYSKYIRIREGGRARNKVWYTQ